MRLIDADALIEAMKKTESEHEKAMTCPSWWSAFNVISEQPTAYSVDKIVAELEERTYFLKDCTKYGNKNAKQQDKSYSTMMMYEVADLVDDLIQIVKQGSVDDDVCDWKVFDNSLTDEPQWVYETTCGKYVGEEHTSKAFVYCPYCSKKINVVE